MTKLWTNHQSQCLPQRHSSSFSFQTNHIAVSSRFVCPRDMQIKRPSLAPPFVTDLCLFSWPPDSYNSTDRSTRRVSDLSIGAGYSGLVH